MANTTNFGWETPDDTDLVKDGAAAIRTLGSSIDTSFVDLKGGTTGQVLAKASNTDLDFTWSAADPLSILDAKGDLISATAADTPARLAVGTDGQILTADSTTSTGLKWATSSSGSETLLSTTSLSGTATTISSISGAYKHLRIWIYDLDITTATAAQIRFNFNSDLGNHYSGVVGSIPGTILDKSNDIGYVTPDRNLSTAATDSSIILDVYHYANTDTHKPFMSNGIYWDATAATLGGVLTFGGYASTSAITSIRIFSSSAQSFTGTVKIYGVN